MQNLEVGNKNTWGEGEGEGWLWGSQVTKKHWSRRTVHSVQDLKEGALTHAVGVRGGGRVRGLGVIK